MPLTPLKFSPPMDFVMSEAPGLRSRTQVTFTRPGTAVRSGTVLTQNRVGAATFAMVAGTTGNPTSSAITVAAATALPGVYRLTFLSATVFQVETPAGVTIGTGTLGSAFTGGGLTFTLTAGGTACVTGSLATITVAAGNGKWIPYTANRAAGPAMGILYNELAADTGDVQVTIFDADCEVRRNGLTGLDAAAEADLRALFIKVRGSTTALKNTTPAL